MRYKSAKNRKITELVEHSSLPVIRTPDCLVIPEINYPWLGPELQVRWRCCA